MIASPTDGISQLTVEDTETAETRPASPPRQGPSDAPDVSGGEAGGNTQTQNPPKSADATAADDGGDTDDAPKKPSRTVCGVCGKEVSRYKCPHCALAYCSVACSRLHRDAHPPDSLPSRPAPSTKTAAPTKPAAPAHPFSVLDNSPELKRLFERYPNLPSTLDRIHSTTLPPPSTGATTSTTRGGLPWSLADVKHKISGSGSGGGGRKKPQPVVWTKDVGLRRGKAALRKARMDPGEDGDGVREYCELVLHLLQTASDAAGHNRTVAGSDHFTAVVRREVAPEEVKLLEMLQRQEEQEEEYAG